MTAQTKAHQIESQLTFYACQSVIMYAAQIYSAEVSAEENYLSWQLLGADMVLCDERDRPVGPRRRFQWMKYRWLRTPFAPSFIGLIDFILRDDAQRDLSEDVVTLQEVIEVLQGGQVL